MRWFVGVSFVVGCALAGPALAWTTSAPPSPVTAPVARFADPDAALEQTGATLQQSFIDNSLGVTGGPAAGGAGWGNQRFSNGAAYGVSVGVAPMAPFGLGAGSSAPMTRTLPNAPR